MSEDEKIAFYRSLIHRWNNLCFRDTALLDLALIGRSERLVEYFEKKGEPYRSLYQFLKNTAFESKDYEELVQYLEWQPEVDPDPGTTRFHLPEVKDFLQRKKEMLKTGDIKKSKNNPFFWLDFLFIDSKKAILTVFKKAAKQKEVRESLKNYWSHLLSVLEPLTVLNFQSQSLETAQEHLNLLKKTAIRFKQQAV